MVRLEDLVTFCYTSIRYGRSKILNHSKGFTKFDVQMNIRIAQLGKKLFFQGMLARMTEV